MIIFNSFSTPTPPTNLPQLVKLCSGMIEAGRAYVSANKLFVNGIKDLSQQCKKEEVISVSAVPTFANFPSILAPWSRLPSSCCLSYRVPVRIALA